MKTFSLFLVLLFSIFLVSAAFAGPSDVIKTAGDIGALAIPASAAMMTLIYKDKEGTMQFIKAYAATMAATFGLKYTIKEKRPNGEKHSFPSAHAASAFAGAAFVQQRDGWKYGLPLYVAASFVGYSRIESKEHYFQDVIAGAAIGLAANLIFTKPFKNISVTPIVGKDFNGIIIGKSF